jgi:hydrogenase-4 component B
MLEQTLLQLGLLTLLLGAGFSFLSGLKNKPFCITASGITGGLASLLVATSAVLTLLHGSAFQLPLPTGLYLSSVKLSLGVDTFSAFFILLIGVIGAVLSVYSIGYLKAEYANRAVGVLGSLFHLFMLAMLLVVSATDAFSFLVFWECMALFSFFLVSFDTQSEDAQKAGFQYLMMTHAGTACLLMMFLLMGVHSGDTLSFSAFASHSTGFSPLLKSTLFGLAVVGFGAKAGLIPLHTWLPNAHPAAPSHISGLMSGVMLKTAVYGFILITFKVLAPFPTWWGAVLASIGLVTALLGITYASVEVDFKRLLAYSSIENMGTIFFAIGIAMIFHAQHNSVWTSVFLAAALFHCFNHAIFKSLLFMGAGAILSTCHTRSLDKLGGLIHKMPITAVLFLVGVMAVCAFPPFNGFLSEWMIFQGLLLSTEHVGVFFRVFFPICASIFGLMGAMVVATFVKAFSTAFLAMPRSSHAVYAKEVSSSMLIAMGFSALACLVLGVTPAWSFPLLNKITASILPVPTNVRHSELLTALIGGSQAYFPLLVVGSLVFFGLLAVVLPRLLGKKTAVRKEITWSCGVTPQAEFEYTASGFSQPLEVAFSKFHSTVDLYDTYFYRPLLATILAISKKVSVIQVGKTQIYLAYILVALVGSLLWIRV